MYYLQARICEENYLDCMPDKCHDCLSVWYGVQVWADQFFMDNWDEPNPQCGFIFPQNETVDPYFDRLLGYWDEEDQIWTGGMLKNTCMQ